MFQIERETLIVRSLFSLKIAFAMLFAGVLFCLPAQAEQKNIALVLDASGSMNGKIKGGRVKIDAAKRAVAEMVNNLADCRT